MLAWLCAAFTVSCESGGGGAQPGMTTVQTGTGEPAAEPLWPLRPGASWTLVPQSINTGLHESPARYLPRRTPSLAPIGAVATYFASPRHTIGGQEVITIASVNETSPPWLAVDLRQPHQPQSMAWWSVGEQGALFHGQLRGILDTPALFFPKAPRVGDAWTAASGGEVLYDLAVTGRQIQDTIFGRRPVWRVQFNDRRAFEINSFGCRVSEQTGFEVNVIEGRTPTIIDPSMRSFSVGGLVTGAVVPLEAQGSNADRPKAPIQAFNVIVDESGDADSSFAPTGLSAVQLADEDRPGRLIVYGRASTVVLAGAGDLGTSETVVGPKIRCYDYVEGTGFIRNFDGCVEAQGVLVPEAGGELESIAVAPMRNVLSTVPPGERTCNPSPNDPYTCYKYALSGLYEDASGSPRVVVGTAGTLLIAEPDGSGSRDGLVNTNSLGIPLLERGAALRLLAPLAEGVAIGTHDANRLGFAVYDEQAGLVRDVHLATHLSGGLGVLARPGGHEYLRVAPDGRIEELVLGPDGVKVRHLIDVALDPGVSLAGAVPWGDALLVVTQHDYVGRGGSLIKDGCNDRIDLGRFEFGLVDPSPSEPEWDTPLYGLRYQQEGADVLVCSPPGRGPPDLDGWSLGGEAAQAMDLGDGCVLVVRARGPNALFDLKNYETIAKIPGAGRVAIGFQPVEQLFSFPECAPLAEGGCVSLTGTYDAGLVRWRGGPTHVQKGTGTTSDDSVRKQTPDLDGTGLWTAYQRGGQVGIAALWLYSAGKTLKFDGFKALLGAVEGGGAAALDASGQLKHVGTDGQPLGPLPLRALEDGAIEPTVFYADGTICGRYIGDYLEPPPAAGLEDEMDPGVGSCWPAGAAEPLRFFYSNLAFWETAKWLPTSNTVTYIQGDEVLLRLDLETGEIRVISPALFGFDVPRGLTVTYNSARGPLGTNFVLMQISGRLELAQLSDEGLTPVAVPLLGAVVGLELFVGAEFFVFSGGLRHPR